VTSIKIRVNTTSRGFVFCNQSCGVLPTGFGDDYILIVVTPTFNFSFKKKTGLD
tara:strand:- start:868 stop:1029 length:162 start_codon:yes stop_codon:yes gene_type:complete